MPSWDISIIQEIQSWEHTPAVDAIFSFYASHIVTN